MAGVGAEVREGVRLRRAALLAAHTGGGDCDGDGSHPLFGTYAHGGPGPRAGRRAGAVLLRVSAADAGDAGCATAAAGAAAPPHQYAALADVARGLAMHVAAAPGESMWQIAAGGDGPECAASAAAASELLSQPYLLDEGLTVAQAVEGAARACGVRARLAGAARLVAGDGVERDGKDFAAEVAAAAAAA